MSSTVAVAENYSSHFEVIELTCFGHIGSNYVSFTLAMADGYNSHVERI